MVNNYLKENLLDSTEFFASYVNITECGLSSKLQQENVASLDPNTNISLRVVSHAMDVISP